MLINLVKIKNIKKLGSLEYRGAVQSIYNLNYNVPKEVCLVFHNGSNFSYNFIIKKFIEEFERKLTCLAENTAKIHKRFSSNRKRSQKN